MDFQRYTNTEGLGAVKDPGEKEFFKRRDNLYMGYEF